MSDTNEDIEAKYEDYNATINLHQAKRKGIEEMLLATETCRQKLHPLNHFAGYPALPDEVRQKLVQASVVIQTVTQDLDALYAQEEAAITAVCEERDAWEDTL